MTAPDCLPKQPETPLAGKGPSIHDSETVPPRRPFRTRPKQPDDATAPAIPYTRTGRERPDGEEPASAPAVGGEQPRKLAWMMACACGALGAGGVHAATTDASTSSATTIADIVVTATKREETVQHVATAVSAYDSKQRDLIGLNTITDLQNFVPGLRYSASLDRIFLRGVGRQTNNLATDPGVATYVDGVYDAATYDAEGDSLFIQRTEVLRGPQGTLYGRNSIGGDINVISVMPTSTFYAEGRASASATTGRPRSRRSPPARSPTLALPHQRQLLGPGQGLLQQPRHSRPDRGRQRHQRLFRGPAAVHLHPPGAVRQGDPRRSMAAPTAPPTWSRPTTTLEYAPRRPRAEPRLCLQPGVHRGRRHAHPARHGDESNPG